MYMENMTVHKNTGEITDIGFNKISRKVIFPYVQVIHNIIKRIIINNLKLGDILYHLPYAHKTDSV